MLVSPCPSQTSPDLKSLLEQQICTLRTTIAAQQSTYSRLSTQWQMKTYAARTLAKTIERTQITLCPAIHAHFPSAQQLKQESSDTFHALSAIRARLKQLQEGLESAGLALRTNSQVAESKTQEVWRLFKIHTLLKAEIQGLCDPSKVHIRLCAACQARLLRRINLYKKGK